MFHIVLFEPEIPQNTGNIMRLCTNTGTTLHLIEPLGFFLDDKRLVRAGLDYRERTHYYMHQNFTMFLKKFNNTRRLFICSTHAKQTYSNITFKKNDAFVFGPETRKLPKTVTSDFPEHQNIYIPMKNIGRSLNLATSVAVITYEAWRQLDFQ